MIQTILSKLLNVEIAQDLRLTGISDDSRKVRLGDVFIAVPGNSHNGTTFIAQAIANGAKVVVTERRNEQRCSVPIFYVDNVRAFTSKLAALVYRDQPQNIIGVTGTNGKTTVAHFCRMLWALLNKPSASIGTLGLIYGNEVVDFGLTTPSAIMLHQMLEGLAINNVQNVCMEVSSHAIVQHRVDNVQLKAAGFTSFSQDHLDYHGTMEEYLAAKLELFTRVLEDGSTAVLNADMVEYPYIINKLASRALNIIPYGYHQDAILKLISCNNESVLRQDVSFQYRGRTYSTILNVAGSFQAHNLLCALGLLLAVGENIDELLAAIPLLTAVPGRMQPVIMDSLIEHHISAMVDYAHTPDALKSALSEARKYTKGRVIILFGCGGNRDSTKRKIMGEIAATLADVVIVTNDNPRLESPHLIRQEIMLGCPAAKDIADREEAIQYAVSILKPNDTLIVAGKGHEKYQIIGEQVLPFDDFEILIRCLRDR
jgi:UDP-N-acetylmuramoyl-L-alanyl-D-glutamate--2,6-diaminopimelate ligase